MHIQDLNGNQKNPMDNDQAGKIDTDNKERT